MNNILQKTLGGLSRDYYIRNFLFGMIFPILLLLVLYKPISENFFESKNLFLYLLLIINTLLYPYARFVYERIVNYIRGDNVFFISTYVFFMIKLITMLLCWNFAIFIAPIGLIYLFYHHTKNKTFE